MRFEDKAGIVTGGSSGIGKAIAQRLASEGASLCLVAAPQDDAQLDAVVAELEETGARVTGIAADVGDPATADRAVRTTLEHFGRIDILANNAGIAYFEELLATPVEHLDHTLHVNVRGMFLMGLAAARAMAGNASGGAIACTASTASFAGEELQVTYNISKGAVAELTRSMAVDLAPLRRSGERGRARMGGDSSDRADRRGRDPVVEAPLPHPARPAGGAERDRGGRRLSALRRRDLHDRLDRRCRRRADGRLPVLGLGGDADTPRSTKAANAVSSRVEGKVALVTGAGTGIGRATCVRLAEEGAEVVVTSRNPAHVAETCAEVEAACGRSPLGIGLDLTDRDAVDAVVGDVAGRFGRIDVISNNAGIELVHGPTVEETTDEEWELIFSVNVTGTFWVCRAATAAHARGRLDREHGLDQLPRCLAERLLLHDVEGSAVAVHAGACPRRCAARDPGELRLSRRDRHSTHRPLPRRLDDPDALRSEYAAAAPLNRMGTAREVANCILFLASDESSFVTGSALVVDGGTTAIA